MADMRLREVLLLTLLIKKVCAFKHDVQSYPNKDNQFLKSEL